MKQSTQSSFNEGLLMDMNPLVTPQTCLSDCLNGTLITFNGNEFTLQNDSGNVSIEGGKLPNGFIPVGMKEYGGIIYTALLNPVTNVCQIGSIPSPDYSKQPKDQSKEGVVISFNGKDFKDNITKLFEFDQFALNPGDEYKIVYTISPTDGKDISKIYNVRWLAIDESGKEYELKSPNIVDSELSDYKYFNQTIRAILGLEITLNNIDWFEVSAYSVKNESDEFTVNFQLYGKNRIKYSGSSDDDLYIRGCKLEYGDKTKYLWDDQLMGDTVSEDVLKDVFNHKLQLTDGFIADQEVSFTITPFDQFKSLDELKRTIFLKMGQVQTSDGFNDLFQYKYSSSNKSLRLDFNANLRGLEDAKVYLEFYDVWSDYSVIVPINDPNPFGKNSAFISTSSEKCTKVFNSSTRGGIDTRQLEQFTGNSEYKPTLFGVEKLIRKSQILRENNLYIVKISIVENASDINNRKYHDIYKILTLNENMNGNYEEYQLTENPALKDFTKLSQKKDKLDIGYKIQSAIDSQPVVESSDANLTLKTDGFYYGLSRTNLNPTNQQTADKKVTKTRDYSIEILASDQKIGYGIVDDLTLNNGVNLVAVNENIIETDEQVKSSESSVIVNSTSNNVTIKNTLVTNRSIIAEVKKEMRRVKSELDKKSIWETLIKSTNDGPSGYIKVWGNIDHPRRINVGANGKFIVDTTGYISNSEVRNYLNNAEIIGQNPDVVANGSRISGGILYWNNTYSGFVDDDGRKHDNWCNYAVKGGGNVPGYINNYMVCLLNSDGFYYPVFINDAGTAKNALKNIFSSVVEDVDYHLYYYGNIITNQDSTTYTKPEVLLSGDSTINFIQRVHQQDKNCDQSNIHTAINDIINRSAGSTGVDYVGDSYNYLQVVNTSGNINFTVKLDELEITTGVDKTILNKLTTSKSDLEFNEASKLISSTNPNRRPYSSLYPNVASRFSVEYENIGNDFKNPKFVYRHGNLKDGEWIVGGRNNNKPGPSIDTTIFEL